MTQSGHYASSSAEGTGDLIAAAASWASCVICRQVSNSAFHAGQLGALVLHGGRDRFAGQCPADAVDAALQGSVGITHQRDNGPIAFLKIPHEGFPEACLDVEARLRLTQGNAVRGAAMATTCDNCHGANSVSGDAAFPNLVGQSVAAIYKQLEDYKSAKRNAAVMGGYVSPLSEQDMLDLATHFASLKADEIRDRVL